MMLTNVGLKFPYPGKVAMSALFFLLLLFMASLATGQTGEEIRARMDIPPNDEQVEYSPADGSVVTVNPPPFTWLPVRRDIEYPPGHIGYNGPNEKIWSPVKDDFFYTLQISRDRNFNSGVITRTGIDISTHALDQYLEPGEWFWRYGAESEKVIFSKTRSFIIQPDARKWPFPADPKKVLESVPETRPRLFIMNDQIGSFRQRALHGDLKETASLIKNNIDKHSGAELPAEPKYVKGIGPEFGEHSWRLIYDATISPIDLAESFALVYLLTGDEQYGQEARRRVLHFTGWDPDGSTSDRVHNETNYRIVDQCSRAFDWTWELFTPAERGRVKATMKRRVAQLYERLKHRENREYHVYNLGSHEERITGFLGQAAVCYGHEFAEAEEWLKYALTIHWNLYPAWGKDDGGWHQGPAYWTGYQSRVLHFVTALKNATWIDLMQKEFFQNTPYYILYSNPPYARFSPFGDGHENPPGTGRGAMMYNYASLLNDPYLRWYADYLDAGHPRNILGILLKNDDLKGLPPSDLPPTRFFPGVGLVSVHTDLANADENIHFLFHSDPYGGISHGHADQNAFTIEAFGEALAIASGYYPWYGSDHHANWSLQTLSSNSITINGWRGQARLAQAKGRVDLFENRDIYDYFVGDATLAYDGLLDRFHRHVIHIRPGVFIMYDDLEAPEPATFEWWLHALSEMQVDDASRTIQVARGDARLKVKFLQQDRMDIDQFTGFPHPPEYRGGSTPDYQDQWHLTASTTGSSNKANFITLLVPWKKGQEPAIETGELVERENEISFRLGVNGENYIVTLKPEVSVTKN